MRLTPEATENSDSILNGPILAVLSMCVPPQSSLEKSPMVTTRTASPYFSPKERLCALALASSRPISSTLTPSPREYLAVYYARDLEQLLAGHGGEVREVEPEPVRLDQGAGLVDVVAETWRSAACSRCVAECARIMARRRSASTFSGDGHVEPEARRAPFAAVQVLAALGLLDVADLKNGAAPRGYNAVVGHLAAHLGVERGLVEHDGALSPLAELAGELALDEGLHRRRVLELVVAGEGGGHGVEAQVEPGPAADVAARGLARSRCSCMRALKPSVSAVMPDSLRTSSVRSSGKP